MSTLQEAEEVIEPAADVLLDARGVDHHPPARLRQFGALGRWSRRCLVLAALCAVVAWTAHGAAERLKPEESGSAELLRSSWSVEPNALAAAEAIDDARLGKPTDPDALMVWAQAPVDADLVDRSRVLREDGLFPRSLRRSQKVVLEWDLAMYDRLAAQEAWIVNGEVSFAPDVFPKGEFDAEQMVFDLLEAEAADRKAALREYSRLTTLDSWYSVGSWVAGGLAIIVLLTALFLRLRAIRQQWGDVQRYWSARTEYRRLQRAGGPSE